MKPITFSQPFKPEGSDYVKLCLWNRYVHNRLRTVVTLLPCAFGVFFLIRSSNPYFIPVYILLVCYPALNVAAFLLRIRRHLRFRSKADTADTFFTVLENGILAERPEVELYHLYHWDEFSRVLDFSKYLLLYKGNSLMLVLQKEFMKESSPPEIRDYIAGQLYRAV